MHFRVQDFQQVCTSVLPQHFLVWLLISTLTAQGILSSKSLKLVWADEFDGDKINLNNWNLLEGDGCPSLCKWGNEELEWYTNTTDNVFVDNGCLVLQAQRMYTDSRPYTSARLITKGKRDWRFGRIDLCAKFPADTVGVWPVMWMLHSYGKYGIWPASGEFDIAAMPKPKELVTAYHYGRLNNALHSYQSQTPESDLLPFDEAFHRYSIQWEKDSIRWYIDDKLKYYVTPSDLGPLDIYPFNEKFHFILSFAIGGTVVGLPTKTLFPKRLEIDYIRVFQRI